jgi:DNA/RNA endonuclease YhcR with UshA esterase domain
VTIEGQIVEITQFSTGVKCYLDDGTGSVALWMPQALFTQLSSQAAWIVGSAARVRGIVEEYADEIEVVPQAPDEATITDVAAPVLPEIVRMADLGLDHVGQRVTVEGEIVEVRPFSEGINCLLDDGSGKLTLLLWQSVLDTMAVVDRERLVLGAIVQASGKVGEYRGELEIVPGIASDVVFR